MTHKLTDFIDAFNGGTRPNRFRITVNNKGSGTQIPASTTHAMAASLPESTVGVIPIPFRGRVYKFPGDRDYNLWNLTMLDDTNGIFTAWHNWSQDFNNHENNIIKTGNRSAKDMFATIIVELLDHSDAAAGALRTFTLQNAWPVSIGAYELNMGKMNEPGQFSCTLAYHGLLITTGQGDAAKAAGRAGGGQGPQ